MPALHESVALCNRCDLYVAAAEVLPCAQCGKSTCPECALPTVDPDLSCCSRLCVAAFNKRVREQELAHA